MTFNDEDNAEALYEAREMGAARLTNDVAGILHLAMAHTGLSQADLARRMGVGESRVSQILNSQGNLRVATLGRLLGSLGLRLSLELSESAARKPQRRRRTRKTAPKTWSVWDHTVITPAGSHKGYVLAIGVESAEDAIHSTGALVFAPGDRLPQSQPLEVEVPVSESSGAWRLDLAFEEPARTKETHLASFS